METFKASWYRNRRCPIKYFKLLNYTLRFLLAQSPISPSFFEPLEKNEIPLVTVTMKRERWT